MSRVEIRDLHKRFGSVNAVSGLSFDVDAGRVTGFLGPNGAGKSTTLRARLGLVHPLVGAPSGIPGVGNPVDGGELLSPAVSVLVLMAWVGFAFAATAAVLRRRDLV